MKACTTCEVSATGVCAGWPARPSPARCDAAPGAADDGRTFRVDLVEEWSVRAIAVGGAQRGEVIVTVAHLQRVRTDVHNEPALLRISRCPREGDKLAAVNSHPARRCSFGHVV